MRPKSKRIARIEVVKNGNSFLALDFGAFGIIVRREAELQGMRVYRSDCYFDFSQQTEEEASAAGGVLDLEISPAQFSEIQAAARKEYVDFGELDRLLKKHFPRIMALE